MLITAAAALSGGASQAAPAQAGPWQAWFAKPAASSCPSGSTLVAPTSATTDALGVVHLSYASFPGLSSAVPPRGFTAARESTGLRADFVRSGLSSATALRLARRPAAPQFCVSGHLYASFERDAVKSSAPSGSGPVAAHVSANWAGYSIDGGTGFNGVVGNWTVQHNQSSGFSVPNDDDAWIGIGGDAADCKDACSLVQTGTEMNSQYGFRSWFEFLCNPAATCGTSVGNQYSSGYGVSFVDAGQSNVVAAGDKIQALVYWSGTSKACFDLTDTSRASGAIDGCILALVPYDPKSIEWIDEDAYSNIPGNAFYMSDFVKNTWSDEESYSPSTQQKIPISTFSGNPNFTVVGNIAATSLNNNIVPPCSNVGVVAYPENISSANGGSSDDLWCSAGPPYPTTPS